MTGMAGVEREMENLFNALRPDSGMDKDHQQRIKDKVFGPTSFYVTEIRPLASLKLVNLNSPSASNQDLVAFSVLVSTRASTGRPACGLRIGLTKLKAKLTGSKKTWHCRSAATCVHQGQRFLKRSPKTWRRSLVSPRRLCRPETTCLNLSALLKGCHPSRSQGCGALVAGDQYTAILVTDPESEEEDPRGGPRVAFQLAPSSVVQPQESAGWQRGVALVLGALTLATALQLGLTANISKLPQVGGQPGIHTPTSFHCGAPSVSSPMTCACWGLQELVDFIAQPDNLRGELPAEIENYDVLPYFLGALPLAASVLGVQAVHEIAHRVVAATKQVLPQLLSWIALLHT